MTRFANSLAVAVLAASIAVAQPAHARRVIVFGLDETGSYNQRERGVAAVCRIVAEMQLGDVLYVRRVTDSSYLDNAAILRLVVPDAGVEPKNKFDPRARALWKDRLRQTQEAKAKAMDVLQRLARVQSPKTDVWGFFAAAADRIAAECGRPGGTDLFVVIIASDMRDNVNRKAVFDLHGARVLVTAFQNPADPAAAAKTRAQWTTALVNERRAATVQFISPDMPIALPKEESHE